MKIRKSRSRSELFESWALPGAFVVSWASGYVAGAIALRYAPPLAMLAWRFGIAALALLVLALAARAPWPRDRRTAAHIVVAGLLSQALQFGCAYTGLSLGASPALAALIIGSMPILIGALSGPLLGERLGRTQWFGLALGFAGVALVVGARLSAGNLVEARAVALVVLALFGLTAGTLYQKRFAAQMDVRTGGFLQAATSALTLGVLSLFVEHARIALVPEFGLALTWLVVVNSLGGITIMYVLIRTGEANRVASLFYLIPPVAA
ncbi:MAG: DMT family transporter, partial [Vulcanimicrobiaceae bacterium]